MMPLRCVTIDRTIASLFSILIALILLASHKADARSAGFFGRPAAHGFAVGWGRHSFNRFHRFRRFQNYAYPLLWGGECAVYGYCDVVTGIVEPYEVPAPVVGASVHDVPKPDCRFQPQYFTVPTERGGERRVRVIRCEPIIAVPVTSRELYRMRAGHYAMPASNVRSVASQDP